MNIVNKLTLRQLKLNKKRTLVTIIGTIISAAMITAVTVLALSFVDLMQRGEITKNGEWHAKYLSIDLGKLQKLQEDDATKTMILSKDLGYGMLSGSQNKNKPYLYIKEFSKEGYENFPIELTKGRLPERPEELVVSEAVLNNAKVDYQIGDRISLMIGKRRNTLKDQEQQEFNQMYALQWKDGKLMEYLTEDMKKSYTIVGFIKAPDWEYTWAPGYTALSYIDKNTVAADETFDASVIYKKVTNSLFDHAQKIIPDSKVEFNTMLLRYYGVVRDDKVRSMLFILSGIIISIIMIGSISLIYNAFAISVSERSRYLGMLSSVGATKKQKRNSVFFEGAVIGAISIPLGIAAGYLGLGITYLCINPIVKKAMYVGVGLRLKVYPISILIALIVTGMTILISTYIPASRASNVSALDAIRQSSDIKIRRKQVHTLRFTRRIFGMEGDLGLKNLKRNRKRYQATVFSLIISMMLFLVVTDFTDSIKKSLVMTQEGINFDICAIVSTKSDTEKEDIVGQMTTLNYITGFSRIDNLIASTCIREADIADFLQENKKEFIKNGNYPYTVNINILDDAALKSYAAEIGTYYAKLIDPGNPSVIVIDNITYKESKTDKYVKSKALKTETGRSLRLSIGDSNEEAPAELGTFEIAALTEKLPMGGHSTGEEAKFNVVMSKWLYDGIIQNNREQASPWLSTYVFFNSDQPVKLQEELESVQNIFGVDALYIRNLYSFRQNENQLVLMVGVFTYAFLILITVICIANIINTISTSIALRKREFAMLKSVGITPKGFNKMLNFESIFYGIKALIYGLPISIGMMYLTHRALMISFRFPFVIPIKGVLTVVVAVFVIVGTAMLYSSSKVRKENIIDALKQEII